MRTHRRNNEYLGTLGSQESNHPPKQSRYPIDPPRASRDRNTLTGLQPPRQGKLPKTNLKNLDRLIQSMRLEANLDVVEFGK